MKKHIGTGKTVIKSEWITSTTVKITYEDFSSEVLSRSFYDQIIKEVKS